MGEGLGERISLRRRQPLQPDSVPIELQCLLSTMRLCQRLFPQRVPLFHTTRGGTVTWRNRSRLVSKEHAMFDVIAFGDVHDKWTRNHTRKRMWHLVRDVKQHLQVNGPWPYALSGLYYTLEVTAAVQALRVAETAHEEISQLAA
jgi:hypothetical protein